MILPNLDLKEDSRDEPFFYHPFAALTGFRRESVESATSVLQIGQTAVQLYRHTAIWRLVDLGVRYV